MTDTIPIKKLSGLLSGGRRAGQRVATPAIRFCRRAALECDLDKSYLSAIERRTP
jgi:hypothetical protein